MKHRNRERQVAEVLMEGVHLVPKGLSGVLVYDCPICKRVRPGWPNLVPNREIKEVFCAVCRKKFKVFSVTSEIFVHGSRKCSE